MNLKMACSDFFAFLCELSQSSLWQYKQMIKAVAGQRINYFYALAVKKTCLILLNACSKPGFSK